MIAAVVVLSVLLAASVAWNVIATRRAIALDEALTTGAQELEDCLDEINKAYGTVGMILQSPLASNDPQIVRIHKEIKRVHDALLGVADRLVSSWNSPEDQENESSE